MTATTGCPWQPTLSYISHIFGCTLSLTALSLGAYLQASMIAHLAHLSTMVAAPAALFDSQRLAYLFPTVCSLLYLTMTTIFF
jgi:hypothetical protein